MTKATNNALSGKHGVVTGGARGIGAAITHALLAHGARVTVLGRSLKAPSDFIRDHSKNVVYLQADVTDAAAVTFALLEAAEKFGPINILVNNAGHAQSAPFLKTSADLWRGTIQVNLDGIFYCTQAALPAMLAAGWGRIVNIASTAGLIGYSYVTAYCAAKHAVIGFTRSLALEVATKGVTVNAVCPGFTETEMLRKTVANIVAKTGRTEAEARGELASRNPQKRLIQPDEVANAVLWLCQPGSESINGQAIAVAGGEVMG